MTNQPLPLFFLNPVPQIKIIKEMRSAFSEVMKQIKVEVSSPCLPKGNVELLNRILPAFAIDPRRIFGRQQKAVPCIAFHQGLPNRVLAARIRPCSIKIGKSLCQKPIHHLLDLYDINLAIFLRQTHQSKPQFFDVVHRLGHTISSLSCLVWILSIHLPMIHF